MAKSLGGPRLLYALHHSHGLPSVRTVNRKFRIPRVLPCVARPEKAEIAANISAFFDPEQKPPPTPQGSCGALPGHVIMLDGVALEEKCRYLQSLRCAVGASRENPPAKHPVINSLEDVLELDKALNENKTATYGKEASVVVLGPTAQKTHYGGIPLAVSASDKSEDGRQLASWFSEAVLDTWRTAPFGECLHGPIWSFATDGESSLRVAKHILCMSHDLDRNSSLGKKLYPLQGLNCRVGSHDLVATCDPKHIFKRTYLYA